MSKDERARLVVAYLERAEGFYAVRGAPVASEEVDPEHYCEGRSMSVARCQERRSL